MTTPAFELLPVYTTDADPWGFTLKRTLGDEPAAWCWVRSGWSIEAEAGTGRQLLREPGRESLRYPHELFWLSNRGQDFPGFTVGPQSD